MAQGRKHSRARKTWERQKGLPRFYEKKSKEEHGLREEKADKQSLHNVGTAGTDRDQH